MQIVGSLLWYALYPYYFVSQPAKIIKNVIHSSVVKNFSVSVKRFLRLVTQDRLIGCVAVNNFPVLSALTLLVGWQERHLACNKLSDEMLEWLFVWGEVQICVCPSWCHCHSLSLAPVNPDWFYLSGFTFLVPAHSGSSGQSPGGRETVVVVVVLSFLFLVHCSNVWMLAVDLMLEQLQQQRNMENARMRLEQEKKREVELKSMPQKRAEAAAKAKATAATGQFGPGAAAAAAGAVAGAQEADMPYMKPGLDKHGKTIERPARPL